ncbi:MAG TPA: glycosyltransferase [Planctomycetaceae bacterium]|jgi:glycosyltransferase involved in cell wall biosynthesis|nr:glycosyltransferase [Planctomycetaceae bacterium]
MRVLVNALSIGSLSGRHVLYGHLRQLVRWSAGLHEFVVLHAPTETPPTTLQQPNVTWIAAPRAAVHWTTRSLWESWEVPNWIRRHGCNLYFTPNGTVLPRCSVPQVSLAQNPWCLMPGVPHTYAERVKARVQRAAYRHAWQHASLMVYNSQHMHELYRQNARSLPESRSCLAYQGVNDNTFAAAQSMRDQNERQPGTIVSVSTMARWKGAETLVRAVSLLQQRGVEARLRLIGSWPHRDYEQFVRREIARLNLQNHVTIVGEVSVEQLHREYASARVFALMSHCESFGIPAVEAQAFGTPVVGSTGCAMPEIGGDGGVFGVPGDPAVAADLLQPLLTDNDTWQSISQRALANVERFRWETCSQPLMEMFRLTSSSAASHAA